MKGGQLSTGSVRNKPETRIRPSHFMSLLALCSFTIFPIACVGAPAPQNNDALYLQLAAEISGPRLIETITDLQDFGTRAFYLNSSSNATNYILGRLSDSGLTTELDQFSAGEHQAANVVATMGGSSPSRPMVLIGAHYDSENSDVEDLQTALSLPAPGADDDASGVAVTLEIARVLAGHQLSRTVKFVAFAAEEYGFDGTGGLAGSMHFASEERTARATYRATYILDMVGYRGGSENHVVAVVNDLDSAGLAHLSDARSAHGLNLTLVAVENREAAYSDHYSFWTKGYPSVLLIESDPGFTDYPFNPYYHSANDTIDALSEEQLTEVTKAVLGGILSLDASSSESSPLVVVAVAGVAVAISIVVAFYLIHRKVRRHDR